MYVCIKRCRDQMSFFFWKNNIANFGYATFFLYFEANISHQGPEFLDTACNDQFSMITSSKRKGCLFYFPILWSTVHIIQQYSQKRQVTEGMCTQSQNKIERRPIMFEVQNWIKVVNAVNKYHKLALFFSILWSTLHIIQHIAERGNRVRVWYT